jgi:ParB family chromosome partitioning protein
VRRLHVQLLEIKGIEPSKLNPRQAINEEGIKELAESILSVGVLQPILVRPLDGKYEVVVGERRLRASILAGLKKIPAVVREMTDDEVIETMLIENAQREELNDVEKGNSCIKLKEIFPNKYPNDKAISEKLGVTVGTIKNWISVATKVPREIQELIATQEKRGDPVPKGTITSQVALRISKSIKEPKRKVEVARVFAERTIPVHKARKVMKELVKTTDEPVAEVVDRVLGAPPEFPFRLHHAIAVREGLKTQTSRFLRPDDLENLAPGVVVTANIWEPSFATLKVISVEKKRLGDFTEEDAKREGGYTLAEFKEIWESIHGKGSWNINSKVSVVVFRLENSEPAVDRYLSETFQTTLDK